MTFFHIHFAALTPGEIIEPGNYGRIIAATGPTHVRWEREQALEQVRVNRYPHKPSRLRSSFWFIDRRTAEFYRSRPGNGGILYEVELVDPNAESHAADFNYLQPIPRLGLSMEQIATLYWDGVARVTIDGEPGLVCTECLAETGLSILRERAD